MESISTFIVTLVTTLILMTAVELISPNNSIKKYISFVLGLILISVMLTPIVYFFSKGETEIVKEISKYRNDFTQTITDDNNVKVEVKRNEEFKKNLDKNCEDLLKKKFKGKDFVSNIICNMDLEKLTYSIERVEVKVIDKGIKKIQKIDINDDESTETIAREEDKEVISKEDSEIKEYLEEILNVKAENIKIYKLK